MPGKSLGQPRGRGLPNENIQPIMRTLVHVSTVQSSQFSQQCTQMSEIRKSGHHHFWEFAKQFLDEKSTNHPWPFGKVEASGYCRKVCHADAQLFSQQTWMPSPPPQRMSSAVSLSVNSRQQSREWSSPHHHSLWSDLHVPNLQKVLPNTLQSSPWPFQPLCGHSEPYYPSGHGQPSRKLSSRKQKGFASAKKVHCGPMPLPATSGHSLRAVVSCPLLSYGTDGCPIWRAMATWIHRSRKHSCQLPLDV